MSGITTTGFETKTQAQILEELQDGIRGVVGTDVVLDADDPFSLILANLSIQFGIVWDQALAAYNMLDPDSAGGNLLDNLCKLVGVTRDPATYTTGNVQVAGTLGTVIPEGRLIAQSTGDKNEFVTTADVTIGAGPTDVAVRGNVIGALEATAGSIDRIVTPVSGWTSVTNGTTLSGGEDIETDASLRAKRINSLQSSGRATDGSIRSDVLELDFIAACLVISNRTDAVLASGQPIKSFRVIVQPTSTPPLTAAQITELVTTIYEQMPAGMESWGSEIHTITDSRGNTQPVEFDYNSDVAVDISATLTVNADYPDNGDGIVEDAIIAYLDAIELAEDVYFSVVYKTVMNATDGIVGLALLVDGGTADVSIDFDERAIKGTLTVTS